MNISNLKIGTRLTMGFGIVLAALVLVGGMGMHALSGSQERLNHAINRDAVKLEATLDLENATRANSRRIYEYAVVNDPEKRKNSRDRMTVNSDRATSAQDKLEALLFTPEGKELMAKIKAARVEVRASYEKVMKAADAGNAAEALKIVSTETDAGITKLNGFLGDMAKLQRKIMAETSQQAVAAYAQTRNITIGLIAGAIAIGALIGWMVTRSITRPIGSAVVVANAVAGGDLAVKIETGAKDETGQLMQALESMRANLSDRYEKDKAVLAENLRVKSALDKCTTNVMVANGANEIIYMNESVSEMMRNAESDLRQQLPNFDANKLMGANIDVFHKRPEHQRGMLSALKSTHKTEIKVGPRTFGLIANPIVDEQGVRLGTVVEWKDRTEEVAVEAEVAGIVDAAVAGDFTKRIEMSGKSGFFKDLGTGINKLMETSSVGLNEVVRVLGALAKGDLTEKITNDYQGTFGQLKDDSNATVEKLSEIIGQIREASESIGTASREIAAGNTDLSQRTEEQASSLEETASSMEELTATVKQNAENAKQANQLAAGASAVAVRGGSVVGEVVGTMSSINESSKKIVDIISVIDGIAFQTNILALNAAVEAARAGEQGRGFAVVASEVRNLAQRSAAAAKEIKTLIGDSVDKVEAGTRLVDDAGKTMEEIVQAVKRVTDIMAEISAASQEQSAGIEQVNQAITQMDQVTQQNAALVEEAAAAAESMKDQATSLGQAVSVFVTDGAAQAVTRTPVERRGPDRPKNVARLVSHAKAGGG